MTFQTINGEIVRLHDDSIQVVIKPTEDKAYICTYMEDVEWEVLVGTAAKIIELLGDKEAS